MVTGRVPFRADTFAQLIMILAGTKDRPLKLSNGRVPAGLERVIGRALQKTAARYQTISELSRDLKDIKLELELELK